MKRHFAATLSRITFAFGLILIAYVAACRDTVAPTPDAAAITGRSMSATAVSTALETFYGPERFTRGKGAPETFTGQIATAHFEAPFVLHVRSGDVAGANRVSSATVQLDGITLLGPSSFNQQQSDWTIPVTMGATAVLSVSLASKPDSYLDIWIEGRRSATIFCPDGRAGAYTSLQAAITAVPVNGTIFVCDGTWDVDSVVVNKPLTIRSLHPGGATLGDSTPNPIGIQGGRSALSIGGITSGLVRIVDLGFATRGRGIIASGSFDKIEIDSARFYGRDSTSSVSVEIFESSVPRARVDVTNSAFDHVAIGVFPVAAVETNVRHDVFTNIHQGGVIFSGQFTALGAAGNSYSFGRIEDNTFRSCGQYGCIRALLVGNVVIARNHFAVMSGVARLSAVWARRWADSPSPTPIIIEDNEIVGASIAAAAPETINGWTLQGGINVDDGTGALNVVRRNHITAVHTGMLIRGSVDARDNVMNSGAYGFLQTAPGFATLQRNDFTGLVNSFQAPTGSGAYQCNWWGSATGPLTPPANVATSAYAPWATQPIAGTTVGCDPPAPVTAMRVCSTAVDGGPMTAATFTQAYNIVAAGGTISFCAETHRLNAAAISKPLTITSESGAMATLDGGSGQVTLYVRNVNPVGTVNITRLRFTGSTAINVFIFTNAGNVNVSSNEFHPPQSGPYGATVAWDSGLQLYGVGIGTVNVEDNTFIGGDVGFLSNTQSATSALRRNTFIEQNLSSIHIAGPKPGPVLIEGNTISGCGAEWCLFTQHAVTAVGNTVTIPAGRSTYAPFRIDNASGGTSVVTNNLITGSFTGIDRALSTNYSVPGRAIRVTGNGQIDHNQIATAYSGIVALNAALTGSDNVIAQTYSPFSSEGNAASSTIVMTRNNLLDYVLTVKAAVAFSVVNLICNYWGSASAPTGATGPSEWYLPFSALPIANQPTVTCS